VKVGGLRRLRVGLEDQIKQLAETTYKTNKEIKQLLGCSGRTVRRHAGRWSDRTRNKLKKGKGELKVISPARILILDIETSPMEVLTWDIFKQYIMPTNILKDWSILSWSAKWLFEPKIFSQVVSADEAIDRRDASIMPSLWDMLNEANIVIAHNAAKFDIPRINSRLIVNGMQPPMPYRVIDTRKVAYKNFAMSSNSLDWLLKLFKLTEKNKQEYDLWKRCVKGDEEALSLMRSYNESDVLTLEELYLRLRPWIKSHPNVGLYIDTDKEVCTHCGNDKLTWDGYYFTPAGKYKAFRCECGAIGRNRYSALTKEERAKIHLSVAN
jgi:hypothetical protein